MRIDYSFNQQEIDSLVKLYNAAPRQVDLALRRTLKKAGRWIKTRTLREVAAGLQVTQKVIKNRFFTNVKRREDLVMLVLWIGLNDLKSSKLGRLSQKSSGAQAGKHFFPGAFVARMPSGHRGVFYRTGRRTSSGKQQIAEEAIEMDDQDRHAQKWLGELQSYAIKTFHSELNFEVFVKNA